LKHKRTLNLRKFSEFSAPKMKLNMKKIIFTKKQQQNKHKNYWAETGS